MSPSEQLVEQLLQTLKLVTNGLVMATRYLPTAVAREAASRMTEAATELIATVEAK